MTAATTRSANLRRTGLLAAGGALLMLALGFAAVPLYRIFCQVTGFGGTTMRVSEAQAAAVKVAAGSISVRFDGNVDRGMPWKFGPEQTTQEMRIGQRKVAYYRAQNLSDKPITGVASFNVSPDLAGKYFNKIQCFCFNQQTLQPGQTVDMPVLYYVDPAIMTDPETRDLQQITLSYTFHISAQDTANGLDRTERAR
ncbi:cytochrome c oxidase assembly protein [Novosphingobium sp. B 225]|uniref:cytochrome c oxidase assembly protein n=1 Tax=Novosphingobium sp. B 225 TaxID=1961849 RepID=UPI000B4A9339|nr:cytochrome c oxidase assembly protein [Novosphingobium sp. B 225]